MSETKATVDLNKLLNTRNICFQRLQVLIPGDKISEVERPEVINHRIDRIGFGYNLQFLSDCLQFGPGNS